eukprot:COSAG04_NODE_2286_length_4387_cov_1.480392_1_plen_24_part_10
MVFAARPEPVLGVTGKEEASAQLA